MNWMTNRNRPSLKLAEQRQTEFFEKRRLQKPSGKEEEHKEQKARAMQMSLFPVQMHKHEGVSRMRGLRVDGDTQARPTCSSKPDCAKSLLELDNITWEQYPKPRKGGHAYDELFDNPGGKYNQRKRTPSNGHILQIHDAVNRSHPQSPVQSQALSTPDVSEQQTASISKCLSDESAVLRQLIFTDLNNVTSTTGTGKGRKRTAAEGHEASQSTLAKCALLKHKHSKFTLPKTPAASFIGVRQVRMVHLSDEEKDDVTQSKSTIMIGCEDPLMLTPHVNEQTNNVILAETDCDGHAGSSGVGVHLLVTEGAATDKDHVHDVSITKGDTQEKGDDTQMLNSSMEVVVGEM